MTTVVELQARFDEEANILWGNKLMEEGVKVICGVPGLKVHSKLCLITRVRNEVTQRYAAVVLETLMRIQQGYTLTIFS